jgi:DNA-directed RNA polymerase alpha subunit
VDLLYDRDQGSLELDQLPGLRSCESFRRYRELSYGDFVYFGILHDKMPTVKQHKKIDEKISCGFNTPIQSTIYYSEKQGMTLDQMDLSVRTRHALCRYGIRCAGDIQEISSEQWWTIRNLGKKSMDEIVCKMQRLGLEMHMPSRSNQNSSAVPIVQKQASVDKPVAMDEKTQPPIEKTQEENESRSVPLAELGLPQNAYFSLLQRGVQTAGDIVDLTPFAWKQMKQLKQSEVVAIQAKLKELGLRIKK